MRFYEVTVETNDFLDAEENTTERNTKKQNISRITDAFLEEYEGNASICMVTAEKRVELAVCVMNDRVDVNTLADKFLQKLEVAYSALSLKEISITNYFNGLRVSDRNRFISDDYKFAEKIGVEDLFRGRDDYFNDKVVDEKKTIENLKSDVDKYHLGDSYRLEMKRIFTGKNQKVFLGNPANYLMISKDDMARRIMARNLISALHRRGRLQSKRYTIIDLGDRDCSIEGLEDFYKINEGATLLLKVYAANFGEGEHARGVVEMQKVCDVVRKKGEKVLTIFSMDTPSDKNRTKLENYMMGVPLIAFCDNLYKKETATAELLKMAAAAVAPADSVALVVLTLQTWAIFSAIFLATYLAAADVAEEREAAL